MAFVETDKIKTLAGWGGNMYFLMKSVNLSNIYMNGTGAEQARAYVVFVEKERKLYPFIYFYFMNNQGRFFEYEGKYVEIKAFEKVKQEALDMVESMGFIMEEVDLISLSPQEMKEIVKTLPFYYADLEDYRKFMEEMEKGYVVDVEGVEIIEEKEEEVEVEVENASEEKMADDKEVERETVRYLMQKYGLGRLPAVERKSKVSGSLRYVLGKLLASG